MQDHIGCRVYQVNSSGYELNMKSVLIAVGLGYMYTMVDTRCHELPCKQYAKRPSLTSTVLDAPFLLIHG